MVNLAALVQSLSKIKIVNMHANKAKRPRVAVNSDHGGGVKTRVEFVSKQKDKIINNVQKSQCNSGKSYAGVVAGGFRMIMKNPNHSRNLSQLVKSLLIMLTPTLFLDVLRISVPLQTHIIFVKEKVFWRWRRYT